ncbi:Cell division control protein 2 like protein [Tritrichomonas foetus]|uniref:cyclin-dependent kinase n=1 Tax=Tritrichomonas foetus TaxID=1144522 RepID=A0A1J4JTC8_9EUKA|nr:Cell division control protein 2 like protein [Tritrichomonas foetus]|eukprot:OHT00525.1 Cell division control protein 2 like protein [Tritrichomonas foetus]
MSSDPSRYSKESKLGEGTYGVVYKAIDTQTGERVAQKIMKFDQEEDGIPSTTLREMSILRSINHSNVVSLKDVIIQPGSLMLITEYLDYDLRRLLNKLKGPLDLPLIRSYAFQLLCGIFVLHTHRIIHRDIKPENLLLDRNGLLKICDFGLSRYFTLPLRQYSPDVVSEWYRAPELLFGNRFYELSIDIWSAGCIIAEMVIGLPLFRGDSDLDQLHKIFQSLGSPTEETMPNFADLQKEVPGLAQYPPIDYSTLLKTDDDDLIDLVSRMLQYDPMKRLNAQDALKHPFFEKISPQIRALCWPKGLPPI